MIGCSTQGDTPHPELNKIANPLSWHILCCHFRKPSVGTCGIERYFKYFRADLFQSRSDLPSYRFTRKHNLVGSRAEVCTRAFDPFSPAGLELPKGESDEKFSIQKHPGRGVPFAYLFTANCCERSIFRYRTEHQDGKRNDRVEPQEGTKSTNRALKIKHVWMA